MTPVGNRLLDSLSSSLLHDLLRYTHPIALGTHDVLYAPETKPTFAYFLTAGVASVATTTSDGAMVNVETIGCEGLVGAVHLLGPLAVPSLCSMQMPGTALKIRFGELREMFLHSAELRGRILEFAQMQTAMLSQIAGCNRMHSVEQRLARLLLMVRDRVGGDTLNLTQESLAEMLGTQRTTVSAVAGAMQDRGVIEYARGRLRIVDRPGLEHAACGCYAVLRDLLRELYRTEDRSTHLPNRQNHQPANA